MALLDSPDHLPCVGLAVTISLSVNTLVAKGNISIFFLSLTAFEASCCSCASPRVTVALAIILVTKDCRLLPNLLGVVAGTEEAEGCHWLSVETNPGDASLGIGYKA